MRPVCLTRKNALFAGHEIGAENWALLAGSSLPASSTASNPAAYITEILEAIIDGHPHSRIEDLMPWRFRKASRQLQEGLG
nr:transposase domain-containing protein [Bradyrhizobium cosmicum]